MVRIIQFKRPQERIQRKVCWFLAHSCPSNDLAT
jgi:hypothetical protein